MLAHRPGKTRIRRRTFLQIFAVAGAAGLLGLPWLRGSARDLQVVRHSRPMLGTVVNLIVYGRDREQAEAAATATMGRMSALEQKLSRFREESEVGRLNRDGALTGAGDELLALLELAATVSAASDGAFDITMLPLLTLAQSYRHDPAALAGPAGRDELAAARRLVDFRGVAVEGRRVTLARPGMGITLDGIAKGYIVDQGVAELRGHGCGQVYVEAGGDLLVSGGKPGGNPWRIGLLPPRPGQQQKPLVIKADNLAVATSGDYHQYFSPDFRHHHIIDPRTGFSSPELASCTVTAPSAALADALATAAMVLGTSGGKALLAQFPGCEACFVTKEMTIAKTSGFTV